MRSGGASGQGAGFARGLGPDGAFSAGAARPNQAVPGAPSRGDARSGGDGSSGSSGPGGFSSRGAAGGQPVVVAVGGGGADIGGSQPLPLL